MLVYQRVVVAQVKHAGNSVMKGSASVFFLDSDIIFKSWTEKTTKKMSSQKSSNCRTPLTYPTFIVYLPLLLKVLSPRSQAESKASFCHPNPVEDFMIPDSNPHVGYVGQRFFICNCKNMSQNLRNPMKIYIFIDVSTISQAVGAEVFRDTPLVAVA